MGRRDRRDQGCAGNRRGGGRRRPGFWAPGGRGGARPSPPRARVPRGGGRDARSSRRPRPPPCAPARVCVRARAASVPAARLPRRAPGQPAAGSLAREGGQVTSRVRRRWSGHPQGAGKEFMPSEHSQNRLPTSALLGFLVCKMEKVDIHLPVGSHRDQPTLVTLHSFLLGGEDSKGEECTSISVTHLLLGLNASALGFQVWPF